MAIISVDSSGHAGNPPVWMVATKTTNKQRWHAYLLSEQAHKTYEGCAKDWREKLSAALMFRTIKEIISADGSDSIIIDWEFQGKNEFVADYITMLFGKAFYGNSRLSKPSISFAGKKNTYVKHAHIKATLARHKRIHCVQAPNLGKDIAELN